MQILVQKVLKILTEAGRIHKEKQIYLFCCNIHCLTTDTVPEKMYIW